MADGDVLLSPTFARRCGIACGGRPCGARAGRGASRGARGACGGACGIRCSCCRSATFVDTHYVTLGFGLLRIEVYIDSVCARGEVKEDAGFCVRIDDFGSTYHVLRCFILDAYLCGTTWWGRIEAAALIVYTEAVCGSRKGIGSAVACGGHGLKHPLRILAGSACGTRRTRGGRGSRGSGLPPCRKREHQHKGERC
jgi:hypothetical protein